MRSHLSAKSRHSTTPQAWLQCSAEPMSMPTPEVSPPAGAASGAHPEVSPPAGAASGAHPKAAHPKPRPPERRRITSSETDTLPGAAPRARVKLTLHVAQDVFLFDIGTHEVVTFSTPLALPAGFQRSGADEKIVEVVGQHTDFTVKVDNTCLWAADEWCVKTDGVWSSVPIGTPRQLMLDRVCAHCGVRGDDAAAVSGAFKASSGAVRFRTSVTEATTGCWFCMWRSGEQAALREIDFGV